MAEREHPIDPEDPRPPTTCPPGTVGKPPWCWYPTVRHFLLLSHTDGSGKPSSARLVSSWCMSLASLILVAHVGALMVGEPPPPYLEGWFYALIGAGTGVNAAGRLGRQ